MVPVFIGVARVPGGGLRYLLQGRIPYIMDARQKGRFMILKKAFARGDAEKTEQNKIIAEK